MKPSKNQRALDLLGLGMDFNLQMSELESQGLTLAEEVDSYLSAPLRKVTSSDIDELDIIKFWQVHTIFLCLHSKVLISL